MMLNSEHANILYQLFATIHLGLCHLTFHPEIGLAGALVRNIYLGVAHSPSTVEFLHCSSN